MLSKPVFQLVFALQSGQRRGFLVGVGGQLVSTHGVKALNIADMLINKEAQFLRQAGVCDAAAARARGKRHEVGRYWGDAGGGEVLVRAHRCLKFWSLLASFAFLQGYGRLRLVLKPLRRRCLAESIPGRRRRRNAPNPLSFPLGTSAIPPPALNSSLSVCYVGPRPLFSRTGPFQPSCVSGKPGAVPSLLLPPHYRYPAGEVWARADLSGGQPTLAAQSHCPFFYS